MIAFKTARRKPVVPILFVTPPGKAQRIVVQTATKRQPCAEMGVVIRFVKIMQPAASIVIAAMERVNRLWGKHLPIAAQIVNPVEMDSVIR